MQCNRIMSAIYETQNNFALHNDHDIAFLTVADISTSIGVSKSKLYKDIREGRLRAEKGLDDTFVISPQAVQQAYTDIDVFELINLDLPSPVIPADGENDPLGSGEDLTAQLDEPCSRKVHQIPLIVSEDGLDHQLEMLDRETTSDPIMPDIQPNSLLTPNVKKFAFSVLTVICSAILFKTLTSI